MFTKTNIC